LTSFSLRNKIDGTVLYVWEQLYEHAYKTTTETTEKGSKFEKIKDITLTD